MSTRSESVKKVERIGRGVTISRSIPVTKLTLDEYLKERHQVTDRSTLSSRLNMLLGRIEKYISALGGRTPRSGKEVAGLQNDFLQATLGILNSDAADAQLGWDVLLFLANKNAVNLFNPRTACQFYHLMSSDKHAPFLSIMTLVVETANIRNRGEFLRTSNIANYTAVLSSDKQRANLASFYSNTQNA